MIRLLLVFGCFLLILTGVEASEHDAVPVDTVDNSRQSLYIEMMSAYAPLSKCMERQFDAGSETQEALLERALASTDAESFDLDASSVMGSAHPALMAARKLTNSDSERAKAIQLALGVFALLDSDKSIRARTYRGKAVALAMISLAHATDGRCSPSNALLYWMEQVPHADH